MILILIFLPSGLSPDISILCQYLNPPTNTLHFPSSDNLEIPSDNSSVITSLFLEIYSTMKNNYIPSPSQLSVMTSNIWSTRNSSNRYPTLIPLQPSGLPFLTQIPTYYPSKVPYLMPSSGPNNWTKKYPSPHRQICNNSILLRFWSMFILGIQANIQQQPNYFPNHCSLIRLHIPFFLENQVNIQQRFQ